tara:strand:+ start:71311 stop:71922 length:612 start_codon:yes stop_codon:yes gene_type:complete
MPTRPNLRAIKAYAEEKMHPKKSKTHKATWKHFERVVAKDFDTHRTPLSGMVKTITNSDTLHPLIYVECKLRSDDFNFWEGFDKTVKKISGKYSFIRIEKSKTGNFVDLFFAEDFLKMLKAEEFAENLISCVKIDKVHTSVVTLFEQTEERAEIEGKIPVVALKKKNKKGYLLGTHPKHLVELHKILNHGKNTGKGNRGNNFR